MLLNRILLVTVTLVGLSACSTTQGSHPHDPLESWNRGVYKFNKAVDNTVAKPLAQGYKAVTPDFIETGISNLFANINDIPNMLNNLMQGEFKRSASDLGRFLINSTLGVAGLWDHASKMGLEKHDEDFGQTLAVWGVDSGPYLMLPILGPSTVRDFGADLSGFVIGEVSEQDGDHWDWNSNPLKRIDHIPTRNLLLLMELVDKRAGLLEFDDQLANAADEYAFVRDVYLQNRKFKVYNGDMPLEDEFECEDEMSEDCDF